MTYPEEVFPLVMFAAFRHPDASFRYELKSVIAKWTQSLRPKYSATEVVEALQGCDGTLLEPFVLNREGQEIAAMLARLAFSEAYEQTRFRIVSNETLGGGGGGGGCVLTNNLSHYYVERFSLGKRRKPPKRCWSFAPRNTPSHVGDRLGVASSIASKATSTIRVSVRAGDSGYQLVLTGVDLEALRWPEIAHLSSLLQKHSVIGDKRETLDAMGIRVRVGGGMVILIPASPEATMRMTAHMLSESLLVVEPGSLSEGRCKIYARLILPTEKEQSLKSLVAVTTGYFQEWLNMGVEQIPKLSESQRHVIARWLMPHDSWVDLQFLEGV